MHGGGVDEREPADGEKGHQMPRRDEGADPRPDVLADPGAPGDGGGQLRGLASTLHLALLRATLAPDGLLAYLACPRNYKRAVCVMFFGWVFFLISLGSPHVLRAHMGRTCGERKKPN